MEMVDQVLPARLKSRLFPLREAAGPRDCLDQLGQVGDLPAGLDPEARLETMAWADRRDISQWTLANVLHFMGGRGGRRFSLRAASNEGMSYKNYTSQFRVIHLLRPLHSPNVGPSAGASSARKPLLPAEIAAHAAHASHASQAFHRLCYPPERGLVPLRHLVPGL